MIFNAWIKSNQLILSDELTSWANGKKDQKIVIDVLPGETTQDKNIQQSRLFHKLRDLYSVALGYDKEYAKCELKTIFGVSLEYDNLFTPPAWPGVFFEIHGVIVFLKSTTEYTTDEWRALIDGTFFACQQNHIDLKGVAYDK